MVNHSVSLSLFIVIRRYYRQCLSVVTIVYLNRFRAELAWLNLLASSTFNLITD